MTGEQAGLGDFTSDGVDPEVKRDYSGARLRPHASMLSDDAAFADDLSCPWCLHPSDDLPEPDDRGVIGCPNCDSAIPADADWYRRGDKIVT